MAGVPKPEKAIRVSFGVSNPKNPGRHPSGLDATAAASRWAVAGGGALKKAAPALAKSDHAIMASLARAAPKVAPALAKFALPLTVAAAGAAAIQGGMARYEKEGVAGAAKGAVRDAADSVTLGLASWAYEKAKKGMGYDAPDMPEKREEVAHLGGESLSHFSSANQSFQSKRTAQSKAAAPGPQQSTGGKPRGFQIPSVQEAAQAAKGRTFSGKTT